VIANPFPTLSLTAYHIGCPSAGTLARRLTVSLPGAHDDSSRDRKAVSQPWDT
jgi:hypothetical protein